MTAIAPVSPDVSIGKVAAAPAAPIVAVQAPAPASPDRNSSDQDPGTKPVAANERSTPPLQPRTVTLSDVTTGLLIQADQDPQTGETVSQFPDRALLESYAQQIRLQDSGAVTQSLDT